MTHVRPLLAGWLPAVVLVAAIAMIALPSFAQSPDAPSVAPPNPAFLDYLGSSAVKSLDASEYPGGLIPEPIDLSPTDGLAVTSIGAEAVLPASYDIRPLGKLTAIRNQGNCGSCWDFASMGSLESSLMPAEAWDFSENNLKNLAGFDISCCSGGNRTMACAYFARWAGPVSESDDPYYTGSCASPAGRIARKHVQEVVYLPNRTGSLDNDTLKQAVMTYGAIYTTYYHSNSYYNSSTAAYYDPNSGSSNHAVCIVGWDDNYSRSNFLTTPAGDGAFLIRNSWGSYWGMAGYFWISYYDGMLGKSENAAYRAETNSYDAIYQYDTYGWISSSGYGSSSAWFANVFTASSTTKIVAASWFTASPNATYEVYVYLNPTSVPTSASLAAYKAGAFQFAGYHTVALDSPVPVAAGQRFSVVVKSTTPGYGYPVPLEVPYTGYCSAATASAGQSYMSSNGTSWTDVAKYYANANVCLKAFAAAAAGPTPAALSVASTADLSASGTAGGPFSPASQAYTLTNTGGAPMNWTASNAQPWFSLSSAGGTLAAGAAATVTASINASANSLAAGSYSDTITFTNATNGVGNATRGVGLAIAAVPPQQGILSVSPAAGFSASGPAAGPFTPASQTYTLTNTGAGSINWTAAKGQSWATISSASGSLGVGASTTVTVSVNASYVASLAPGAYADTLTFTNTTNGNGSTARALSLTVTATTPPSTGYRVVPTTYAWISPGPHLRLAMADDTVSAAQTMPFNFTFYGKQYNRLYVASNGLMAFASSGLSNRANTSLPTSVFPNAAIYPYWDDLNPGSGGSVRIGTVGSAPSRKVVVSWVDVPAYASLSCKFSFQVILEESTGDVVIQYLNVSSSNTLYGGGRSATIGIENENGTQALLYAFNRSGSVTNGTALRFTTLPGVGRRGG